ncbi:unnamed protein product [Spirodela intermedia]|uniref:BZIP domain-containing protein n=1 Tax=Spirodela intermedia TaxID=51605 RepID=A0A7I8J0M3_SPIIN|nr:unnamed protein product [Spirodela intermedia]CAA6663599.1 unnamed protein product [Spirodela intermedia]
MEGGDEDLPLEIADLLRSIRACSHTHSCSPPSSGAAGHTHTCRHTHTQVVAPAAGAPGGEAKRKQPRKLLGNREAVRKYREKKKARTAFLEEEAKKLRLLNKQLSAKLQALEDLEAEVVRLRGLLVDLRGKIDTDMGGSPFQNPCDDPGFQCNPDPNFTAWTVNMPGLEGCCRPARVDSIVTQVPISGRIQALRR